MTRNAPAARAARPHIFGCKVITVHAVYRLIHGLCQRKLGVCCPIYCALNRRYHVRLFKKTHKVTLIVCRFLFLIHPMKQQALSLRDTRLPRRGRYPTECRSALTETDSRYNIACCN